MNHSPLAGALLAELLAALLASSLAVSPARAVAAEAENWNLQLQATHVWQPKPSMTSPYAGAHSLAGAYEQSYSLTATAALGLRLGRRTELYVNPEMAQGVPLSGLQGLGSFTNGEMARSSGDRPKFYRARLFVRHVIDDADEQEDVASGINQLGGAYATRRWVFTAGNLSVLDIFDANRYSHDPRSQFMNWTLMTHGAYDYAADARGYSWGLAAEYLGDGWAVRFGRFIQPQQPNGLALDASIGRHYGDQLEFEHRYDAVHGQPGVLRVLAFRNRTVMARYADALAKTQTQAQTTGLPPDLAAVRGGERIKAGLGVNIEQPLSDDTGLFARAMWADGKTETYAFTEVDRSLSLGLSSRGAPWGRAADTVGLALAINGLSDTHRQVLRAGGLTFFLGDGRLNYRPEQVLEAYYQFTVASGVAMSLDLQRIANPGYNADRGPASFIGLRLHVER